MVLVRDGGTAEDIWLKVDDEAALPADGAVLVSLARWRRDRDVLLGRGDVVGVRLASDQEPKEIAEDLDALSLVALEFPRFTDGRAFSHARVLRENYRFRGEIRAVGKVLRDQFLFLQRCGFDTVEVDNAADAAAWPAATSEISVFYQPSTDGRATPSMLRRRLSAGANAQSECGVVRSFLHDRSGPATAARMARDLNRRYGHLDGEELLRPLMTQVFPERIALVTAFGAESVVLLDMVARINTATPIIFLDTGKHFDETLAYRDELVQTFGLTDVRAIGPNLDSIRRADAAGTLWASNPDRCCYLRKVEPLRRALIGFDAWIAGAKRYHGAGREALPVIEADGGRIKINPLASWSPDDVDQALAARQLPRHPLVAAGFLSIGCAPCTAPTGDAARPRSGRWPGFEKTECGIHMRQFGAVAGGKL